MCFDWDEYCPSVGMMGIKWGYIHEDRRGHCLLSVSHSVAQDPHYMFYSRVGVCNIVVLFHGLRNKYLLTGCILAVFCPEPTVKEESKGGGSVTKLFSIRRMLSNRIRNNLLLPIRFGNTYRDSVMLILEQLFLFNCMVHLDRIISTLWGYGNGNKLFLFNLSVRLIIWVKFNFYLSGWGLLNRFIL